MSALAPDLDQARNFLELLDEEATGFTFQMATDAEPKPKPDPLARAINLPPDNLKALVIRNGNGAAIWVMINAGDGKARKAANITRVRAVFADLDGAPLDPVLRCELEPHVVVESSPGKFHVYWFVTDLPLDQFEGVQRRIAAMFDGDSICDLCRVLRVPGFIHAKDPAAPFMSRIVHQAERLPYSAADILRTFPPLQADGPKAKPKRNGRADLPPPITADRLAELRAAHGKVFNHQYKSTSERDFALACLARKLGWPEEDAIALIRAVQDGAKGARPEYLWRTVAKAYATVEAEFASAQVQHGFKLTTGGVYHEVEDKEGNREWVWIASPIEVLAETRNASGEAWGRLLRIPDRDGINHVWAMPMKMLAGAGIEYRERLLELGAELAPGSSAKGALHTYLSVWRPPGKARCVERTGWHNRVFVLPDATYGETNGEPVLLQAAGTAPQYDLAGTLDGWQNEVGAVGNSRLVLAISASLAAPLLHLVCEESGGLHLVGPSSTGKTTIAEAAASVWGVPKRSWRMTTNAAESTARGSCDALLFLDEIGQAEPWDIDAMAYLLGNESGKGRMKRDATARETLTWRTLFLSTGEIGLLAKLSEIGRRLRAGQAMRLIEVAANAGAGHGVFEMLHGAANGDALARRLRVASKDHRGHAARAFLQKVAGEFGEVAETVVEIRRRWVEQHVAADADGQVRRAAGRLALLAAAGELAQMWGVVPWPEGEADRAAQTCFEAWLATRGGAEPQEIIEGLAQARKFFEQHGSDRFERAWEIRRDRDGNEIPDRVVNRAGFRRLNEGGDFEYFILPEAWRHEVCKGCDHVVIARAMIARGWLQAGDGSHLAQRAAIPRHGKIRVYHVLPGALA